MARSKRKLLTKEYDDRTGTDANWFIGEVKAKKKNPTKQGTNKKWLRTRKRIRNKILR